MYEKEENSLYHYGILGMKWGIRRFQNKDGSYTSEGKQRYEYKSLGQKVTAKRAAKAEEKVERIAAKGGKQSRVDKLKAKSERYKKRSEKLKELDDRELEYAKKVSTGATIADRLLLGSLFTSKPTQQFYAIFSNGKNSESAAVGKSVAASLLTGRIGSQVARSLYARGHIKGQKTSTSSQKKQSTPAFSEKTRLHGAEEAEAWKKLAKYYGSQRSNK